MGLRRQARESALQILFQLEYDPKLTGEQALELYSSNFELSPEVQDFASILIKGVIQHPEDINNLINAHSDHWKLDRMALVDRNILKLAVYELKFLKDQVPQTVVINEAIEIAKKFGSSDSPSFVNGVLDKIAKSLHQ